MAVKRRIVATPRRVEGVAGKTEPGWFLMLDCGHWKFLKNPPRSNSSALCSVCPDVRTPTRAK